MNLRPLRKRAIYNFIILPFGIITTFLVSYFIILFLSLFSDNSSSESGWNAVGEGILLVYSGISVSIGFFIWWVVRVVKDLFRFKRIKWFLFLNIFYLSFPLSPITYYIGQEIYKHCFWLYQRSTIITNTPKLYTLIKTNHHPSYDIHNPRHWSLTDGVFYVDKKTNFTQSIKFIRNKKKRDWTILNSLFPSSNIPLKGFDLYGTIEGHYLDTKGKNWLLLTSNDWDRDGSIPMHRLFYILMIDTNNKIQMFYVPLNNDAYNFFQPYMISKIFIENNNLYLKSGENILYFKI